MPSWSSSFSICFHSKQFHSNLIRELFITAPNKEQHQLGNETITVEIEKKTEQWLGATLQSTGENGNVLVSLSITALNNDYWRVSDLNDLKNTHGVSYMFVVQRRGGGGGVEC